MRMLTVRCRGGALAARLLLAAVVLRVVVPVGYMFDAAALAQGGWGLVPCPSVWGAAFLPARIDRDAAPVSTHSHAGHPAHADTAGDTHAEHEPAGTSAGDTYCVFTPAAAPAATTALMPAQAVERDRLRGADRVTVARFDHSHTARAPPISSLANE